MIYNYVIVTDANVSLRSASEMRSQIGPSSDSNYLPLEIWYYIGAPRTSSTQPLAGPVNCAPQFSLLQNSGILFVSRRINQETTHILCARNNFHYSCMRSFPGPTIDLLRNLPWPVPFSCIQLSYMRSLTFDYCNSHYGPWTDATVDDIDNCMTRNIIHISKACPSLKTFSLYIFSRPPLTAQFHERLGTGQAALALSTLRKRLDWLNLISTWPFSAVEVLGQTIAPGCCWQYRWLTQSGLPKVTISKWQLVGVASRGYTLRVLQLDCKKAVEDEEVECGDAGSEEADNEGH